MTSKDGSSASMMSSSTVSFFLPGTGPRAGIIVPKRKRLSGPKVRTGCVTCKKRHVKCDERKPKCERCEKAFITCDGYASPEEPKTPKVEVLKLVTKTKPRVLLPRAPQGQTYHTLSIPVSGHPGVQWNDMMYLELFQREIVRDLSGFCYSDFWSRTVLRESRREDCIRESILAIGALCRRFFPGRDGSPTPPKPVSLPSTAGTVLDKHHEIALRHHTQAVAMFRRRITANTGSVPPRLVIIATLLFVAFEFLQGNTRAGDSLITSGIMLLKDSLPMLKGKRPPAKPKKRKAYLASYERTFDDGLEEIEHLLPRLSVLNGFTAFCVQQHDEKITNLSTDTDCKFPELGRTSIEGAIQMWNEFQTKFLMFISRYMWKNLRNQAFDMVQAEKEQAIWLQWIYRWRDLLEDMVETYRDDKDDKNPPACTDSPDYGATFSNPNLRSVRLVQVHCVVGIIFVSSCLDQSGLAFDNFWPQFQELLERCKALIHDRPDPVTRIRFSFDVGLIPSLGFILSSCRSHEVRREAMKFYEQVSWREGAWDVRAQIRGRTAAIALEEAGMDEDGFIPPDSRYFWTSALMDLDQQKVMAEYTRLTPGEDGEPVKVTLWLDL